MAVGAQQHISGSDRRPLSIRFNVMEALLTLTSLVLRYSWLGSLNETVVGVLVA